MSEETYLLGVDIGGTCTDVTLFGTTSRQINNFKTASTPGQVEAGVVEGIRGILEASGHKPEACINFVHGATLGLNSILTRSGARVGLLVTSGFGDIIEMGRMQMPDPFNLYTSKPEPLVRKRYVAEVTERMRSDGRIETPLDMDSLSESMVRLTGLGVDAIAVCFINAFKNPAHETAAAEFIRRSHPDLSVWLSSETWPEIREYERAMVTVMNAYVAPIISKYLNSLQTNLSKTGMTAPLNVTTSNGGMLPASLAKLRPGTTLLSGPAAGIIASAHVAKICGIEELIAFDMGGTSTEVSALTGAQIPYSTETQIGDFPVIFPAVDVVSVGAGGGSIARLDNLGVLKVGPESAGADPGPACYGRGGANPTVTDAYVVAGVIEPTAFLGGRLTIKPDLAQAAYAALARGTSYTPVELAAGVLRVATSNLMVGIGRVEAHKGLDLRGFTLLAYGGAGPTHACALAEALGLRQILVPLSPGTFCAWGSLLADFRVDHVQTFHKSLAEIDLTKVTEWFAAAEARATEMLRREAPYIERVTALRSADMRYQGQGFDIDVLLTDELLTAPDSSSFANAFHDRYGALYGLSDATIPVDFINARLTLVGHTSKPALPLIAATRDSPLQPVKKRPVFIDGRRRPLPVFFRSRFVAGDAFVGPCLVDQDDTTIFVHDGWTGAIDEFGFARLTRN